MSVYPSIRQSVFLADCVISVPSIGMKTRTAYMHAGVEHDSSQWNVTIALQSVIKWEHLYFQRQKDNLPSLINWNSYIDNALYACILRHWSTSTCKKIEKIGHSLRILKRIEISLFTKRFATHWRKLQTSWYYWPGYIWLYHIIDRIILWIQ